MAYADRAATRRINRRQSESALAANTAARWSGGSPRGAGRALPRPRSGAAAAHVERIQRRQVRSRGRRGVDRECRTVAEGGEQAFSDALGVAGAVERALEFLHGDALLLVADRARQF